MKPLHKIPKEIRIIISEQEKQGMRYLYSIGYHGFRRHGHWDIWDTGDGPWMHNINLVYWSHFVETSNHPVPPFNPSWIRS